MLNCATIHLVVTADLLQILMEAGFADNGMIGVTQPRRVVSSAPDRAPACCKVCLAGAGAPASSSPAYIPRSDASMLVWLRVL